MKTHLCSFGGLPLHSGACLSKALIRTGLADIEAFQEVYKRTSVKLGSICTRICGSRQSGEDVLHDVYLIVWRRAAGYKPERGSAIAWLSRIAHNRSIDWVDVTPGFHPAAIRD